MKLTFYNHYGAGDLFESREFVRDTMKLLGVEHACYAHRKFPGFFDDLPITSVDMADYMTMRSAYILSRPDEVLINTWIGCRNGDTNPRGDYVVWPGVGCTVEHLYRMWNDYLRELGLPQLPRTIAEYLPAIDYVKAVPTPVRRSVIDAATKSKFSVMLCNGSTGSGHAANFDMGLMLDHIPVRDDVHYFITENCKFKPRPDVLRTDDITGRSPDHPCDLNAIGYLSQFCDVIVGRCSGAQMVTQTLANWMNGTKTLVCFTQHRNGACFVLNPEALGLKMRVVHSDTENPCIAAGIVNGIVEKL